ncbi:MAG: ATPase [Phycisphaerae bacterium]|nr:ATPase [Phycisphaerae bacterium]MBM90406.1 ATPase [Phycisphaerae bacterium]
MSTDALHVTLSDDTVAQDAGPIRELIDAVGSVVVGQEQMVRSLVIGMLTGGHVLLEGVPGLAKTLTVTTLAQGCHAEFSRIQFTPDLLPADVIGTLIYNPKDGSFTPRKGPIFANIVLADEINRAPAKVQSALLEAMQEKRATIGDTTYSVGDPFLVLATQNPIEQEGTYPLPEAQVDRFMLKLHVGYPTKDEERVIVDRMMSTAEHPGIKPVVNLEQIASARDTVNRVFVDEKIKDYIVSLVHATRDPASVRANWSLDLPKLVEFGASPRASLALARAARANAFLDGRAFVTPSDIKTIGMDVLRHRVLVSYEAEAEGISSEDIVSELFARIPTP